MVWYSHLFQNFPQFIVIHTVKGFGIVNKAEIDVFLELSWLPWWLTGKESTCDAGDPDSIPELGRSPGGGHSSPLQYSCLENSKEIEAWWAAVHRVAQSQTQLKCLSSSNCNPLRQRMSTVSHMHTLSGDLRTPTCSSVLCWGRWSH